MTGRIPIEAVSPVVDCGRAPAKAVVGEWVTVSATVYREGHDALGCAVVWRSPAGLKQPFTRMTEVESGTDRWAAPIRPDLMGRWSYCIEAWSDPYRTWRHAVVAKLDAGQGAEDLANDLADGAEVLVRAIRLVPKQDRPRVTEAVLALRDSSADLAHRVAPALTLERLLWCYPVRDLVSRSSSQAIWVDRPRAAFGSWYEFFPRSESGHAAVEGTPEHGSFKTAAERLPAIADMGFDIVYLPPIHPIGLVNRKGANNALVAGPDDPGVPWAIGSADGGHDAVHPQLGSLDDFDAFVARTRELGMEVALDLALQCAPDHPWVREHPEWFTQRADGSIAYAENPPKKYQDIYPLNFDRDPKGLRAEILRVVTHWIDHGVKVFRVDNPHTKPVNFWQWLIEQVHADHPDVLFLAEAFTRPAMMKGLAKAGFTQSYTYFTWRTSKAELTEFGADLVASADFMRPNLWPNTPDILHASLQQGGPPMFTIRAVLAATLSPSWGVYSGFELFEHVARAPGSEEYLDSEKYQLRPRDWAAAAASGHTLAPLITRLNAVRRANPALQQLRDLTFHHVDNDAVLCFSKRDAASGNTVLVVCSLDPHSVQWGNTALDLPALGVGWSDRFAVRDELTGAEYDWGQFNAVRLDPYEQPAHLLTVHPHG
ncbi:alpha-1,4-glucan--maltose-1-phosphate maltosyltransferase [Actinocatenispora comari]|uniref:Alpha-1,4-glucan:maltose-1-phosphate maltosyltransferase n=1 Tax=Actinocatenispora comari TaxID=2807577 RepID=A0A8J4AET4_9ACTN|nr:alpha-1,4-glucan--maltose-1-phosphate maltosyltransferase [Actinocatenispora comari]GIL28310.1 alpha-1,4-glucan:maltose-1-phosphate maltosyltransferase [Actinocatenispora comari]